MIESLNTECHCVTLDRSALRRALEADPAADGLAGLIEQRCPHLFAAYPVFVSSGHAAAMAQVIRAVESVVALPAYQAALGWAPPIARFDAGPRGVFMGYDFHIGKDGPRLIEINTNAGGALLNGVLGRAQRACCPEVEHLVAGPVAADELERTFVRMFVAEWHAAGRAGLPRRVAIVDERPPEQFLYPEFLLFAQMFRRAGIEASVLAPQELRLDDEGLLVYNRLTDFALEQPAHAALRDAYLARRVVMTPHPRAHALHADKRNLALLTDDGQLRAWGLDATVVQTLIRGIARTERVTPESAARLWEERRKLFFKPATGYGSKAAYRGEKITRRVWDEIVAGEYVAQEFVAPGVRVIGPQQALKVDVRNYVYDGNVQLLAARLYQHAAGKPATGKAWRAPRARLAPARSGRAACRDG